MPNKDPIKRKAYQKSYRQRNKTAIKTCMRKYNLKRNFNLSLEDYNIMWEDQKGCCALCLRHQSSFTRGYSLAVDHNHSTGQVRGLLCYFCNKLLGRLEDENYFERVVNYLKEPKDVREIDREGNTVH